MLKNKNPNPMLQPDGQEILKLFDGWAKEYEPKIVAIHGMDWGWEGWAQGDLAHYMSQKLGGAHVNREHYYDDKTGMRADLVVIDNDGSYVHIFELKCKSREANFLDFEKRCYRDYLKLQNGHKESDSRSARARVVVFYTDHHQMSYDWNLRGHGHVVSFYQTWK